MAKDDQELGPCGLCGRPMIAGPSVDRHHLIPKSQGGRASVWMHRVCHKKVHSLFSEKTLARQFNTFEALLEHEDIAKFVRWVQKQDPEFNARHRKPRP